MIRSLSGLFGASGPEKDPVLEAPGLHVISDYGEVHRHIDSVPTEQLIRSMMLGLDWENGFHQVLVVRRPGVAIEVGGSTDPTDGLSSTYTDAHEGVERVTTVPPNTVDEMIAILLSFHRDDGEWDRMFVYE